MTIVAEHFNTAVGVDTHAATHTLAVVTASTGAELPVTNAAILAHIASGALVVVGSHIVRRQELGAALKSLDDVDTRVLGLVLMIVSGTWRWDARVASEERALRLAHRRLRSRAKRRTRWSRCFGL